jgi:hypothetical protein
LERIGESDPVEGTNVTLICRIKEINPVTSSLIWSYQINDNGVMQIIDENDPPTGLTVLEK